MKKLVILFTFALIFCITNITYAASCTAGTATMSIRSVNYTGAMRVIAVYWVADGAGDVTGTSNCDVPINGYLYMVVTEPGTGTPPTTLYDITISDSDGADVVEGYLADRSATLSEQVSPYIGGVPMARFVRGSLSIVVSNAGAGGEGTLIFYIYIER